MVAYSRSFSDIPFSQEIFEKLEEIRKTNDHEEISPDLKMPELAPQFEARHKLINKLIYQANSDQVLELAAGFSPRGLFMSEENKFNYVEVDLPGVIKEKEQITKEIAKENNFNLPDNLHFEPGNVLDQETFERATEYFNRSKPVTIINEGLLRYLNFEEKAIVAKNIHKVLKKFGGSWITSDISLGKIFSKEDKIVKDHTQKLSTLAGKDIAGNRFETEEDAKKYFEGLGFSVERHSFMEVKDELSSPQKLNLQGSLVKDQMGDAVVFVMKAV